MPRKYKDGLDDFLRPVDTPKPKRQPDGKVAGIVIIMPIPKTSKEYDERVAEYMNTVQSLSFEEEDEHGNIITETYKWKAPITYKRPPSREITKRRKPKSISTR